MGLHILANQHKILIESAICLSIPDSVVRILRMCYSAMVIQDIKELGIRFKARAQLDLYADLFHRRALGESLKINKAMERQFILNPSFTSDQVVESVVDGSTDTKSLLNQIQKDVLTTHTRERESLERELFALKKRLADAERKLIIKATKKFENEKRISSSKIGKVQNQLKKLRSTDFVSEDEQSIFPFYYLSMVVVGKSGERIVAPFRYHLRPRGQSVGFDQRYSGCYNARRDNLQNPFWQPVFGKRHGIILIKKFYEHVAANDYRSSQLKDGVSKSGKKNLILCFEPEVPVEMMVPCLWDVNRQPGQSDLFSCALITDNPPPEISETGHDRCPVFLKEKYLDLWLNPKKVPIERLYEILQDREQVRYRHSMVA